MPADPTAFRREILDGPARWRCAVRDHGVGTVVAQTVLGTAVFRLHVALDGDEGTTRAVLPSELRRLPPPDGSLAIPAPQEAA